MTPSPSGNASHTATGDDTGPQRRGPTRRQALALAGGTAAVLGATVGPFGGLLGAGAADDDQGSPEMATTAWLTSLELAAAELYDHARDASGFDDAARDLAATCAAHHTAQAAALSEMVSSGGGETPEGPNKAFLSQFRSGLDGADGAGAKADFLATMENRFAATYLKAFDTLTSPSLAALIAKILASDAAHAVAWSAAAGGFDGGDGLPGEDAIPESQTDADAFDRSEFKPDPPETATDDGDDAGDDDATTSTGDES